MDDETWPGLGVGDTVVSAEKIATRVAELGAEITSDYAGKAPLIITVLKGGFIFTADLVREIALPVEIEFMALSSYGNETRSSGSVQILKDVDVDIAGRDVIVVEDIVDTGLTLRYLLDLLGARQPASMEICSLFLREEAGTEAPDLRYVGFRLPPVFIIGYGLDVAGRYRNLPHVAAFDPSV